MTGWEFGFAQKQDRGLANSPVIVISAVSPEKADVLGNVRAALEPLRFQDLHVAHRSVSRERSARLGSGT